MEKSVFLTLNELNCNDHTEKKNNLTYLSWAWAWGMVKTNYPEAFYTIYENKDGWCYFSDGKTCWVKTGVTINGLEHIEYLPVMDFKNKSITANDVTSFDVNKAIQRSLTKACARHGLGLYIYAGEDLPEGESTPKTDTAPKTETPPPAKTNFTKPAQQKNTEPAASLEDNQNDDLQIAFQEIAESKDVIELMKTVQRWIGFKENAKFLSKMAIREAQLSVSTEQVTDVWNKYKTLHTDKPFVDAVAERGKKLKQAA